MYHFNAKTALFAVALIVFSIQAQAQQDLHDSIDLKEVKIVGKSKARRMQEQAYAISVVDLARQYVSATPLNKVLNTVTSVKIREEGGLGSNYSLSMNGFSGNQVKFFIDGIPMDNFGSSSIWLISQPIWPTASRFTRVCCLFIWVPMPLAVQ